MRWHQRWRVAWTSGHATLWHTWDDEATAHAEVTRIVAAGGRAVAYPVRAMEGESA